MRVRVPGRPLHFVDDAVLWYDDDIIVTRDAAWTAVQVPLESYGFRSHDDRVAMGWASTLALGALREGDVHLKVARKPFGAGLWALGVQEHVQRVGAPAADWPRWREGQAERMERVQASEKVVVLLRRLGHRNAAAQWNSRVARGPIPVVAQGERAYWRAQAATARELLARGGLNAVPVDSVDLRWLRRHSLVRGLESPTPAASKRRSWDRDSVQYEFDDVELTPMARGVRVDSIGGTRYTATLVCATFPEESWFPETPPWLAHLDWVGPWAEADLRLRLVPPRKARRDVVQRLRLAQDQRQDAHGAGADLPIETERVHALARRMEADIPALRRPLVYGWGRIHVDASSEEELAYRVQRVIDRYADEDSPHIDLALPTGMAQVDLLLEGVPGQPVKHRSWKQRWLLETVGCALPQAGSNLAHPTGLYVGPTTGRYVQAATLDPHHSITRRSSSDVEGPGGMVLLGAQRAGKSSALGTITQDATTKGYTTILIDFSGPLARLATMERNRGRMQVLDLSRAAAGSLDPMSPAVIPGDGRTNVAVREARKHLTRDTLTLLAWKRLQQTPVAESDMLRAIAEVALLDRPSLAEVLTRMGDSEHEETRSLTAHLMFELGTNGADMLIGTGDGHGLVEADDGEPVTRIITAPGLALPAPGQTPDQWQPAQALGAAVFGVAAHLAHRMLWDLPAWHLKYLLVDEAHIAMNTDAGRRVIEQSLRDGPKHSVVVGLATHNAVDLADERIVNALATKMLFRSTSDVELGRAIRVAGLEDTPSVRRQIRRLRNGECIMVTGNDIRDRVQWDLWDDELRATLNTTAGVRHE